MPIQEPSRLIKARAARNLGSATSFNFDDLRRQCDDYVAEARQCGQQLLAQAAQEAQAVRQAAHAEGLSAGQQAGLAAAHELVESRASEIAGQLTQDRLRTVLPAFQAAASALVIERDRWITAWEGAAVKLSAAIAQKLMRHELAQRPEVSVSLIQEALQLAAGQPQIQLRLNPRDLEQLQSCGDEALGRLAGVGEARFVPDEAITPGGCVVETRHGVIDARLETQLDRIVSELLDGT
jgi:flagellar assembly protein FliH